IDGNNLNIRITLSYYDSIHSIPRSDIKHLADLCISRANQSRNKFRIRNDYKNHGPREIDPYLFVRFGIISNNIRNASFTYHLNQPCKVFPGPKASEKINHYHKVRKRIAIQK